MEKRGDFTFFIINLFVSLLVSDYFRNFAGVLRNVRLN